MRKYLKIYSKQYLSSSLFICTFLLVSLSFSSCKKEEEVDPNPVIEFVNLSTEDVISFQNNIVVTLSYQDPQGDIGEEDPDKRTVSIKDSRLDAADYYHIPPLTPEMAELEVSGEFTVTLPALFLLGNGTEETTKLTIQIEDRAGNKSNTVISPSITISNE